MGEESQRDSTALFALEECEALPLPLSFSDRFFALLPLLSASAEGFPNSRAAALLALPLPLAVPVLSGVELRSRELDDRAIFSFGPAAPAPAPAPAAAPAPAPAPAPDSASSASSTSMTALSAAAPDADAAAALEEDDFLTAAGVTAAADALAGDCCCAAGCGFFSEATPEAAAELRVRRGVEGCASTTSCTSPSSRSAGAARPVAPTAGAVLEISAAPPLRFRL